MTKIYIIAGEPSGDYIASLIMRNLSSHAINFEGIGGPLMIKQGLKSLFPMTEISLMGFLEILPHIFRLKKLLNQTIRDVLNQNPDMLITIDSPGFTYRVAKKVRQYKPNLKILHIVAPTVWAYKEGRALKYARIYNNLFTLLPFEPPYFEKVGLKSTYIGHPILEQEFYSDKQALKNQENITKEVKTLCITAGSRKGEIVRHMPIFVSTLKIIAKKYNNLRVIFVLATSDHEDLLKQYLVDCNFNFSFSTDRLRSFALADVGLAKSGTNTIEIAASGTPQVVAYKINYFSFLIVKALIKIRYASLINIISNKEIIPEFLQNDCQSEKIALALLELLSNPEKAEEQIQESQKVLKKMGFQSSLRPSEVAATKIWELL